MAKQEEKVQRKMDMIERKMRKAPESKTRKAPGKEFVLESLRFKYQLRSRRKARRFLFRPGESRLLNYWDFVGVVVLSYTAAFTPVEVAFLPGLEDSSAYCSWECKPGATARSPLERTCNESLGALLTRPLTVLLSDPPTSTPCASTCRWNKPRFIIARCVDLFYVLDLCLQFCIPFRRTKASEDGHMSGVWVEKHSDIACHYFRSWLLFDIATLAPSLFDILPALDVNVGSDLDGATILRTFRVLRFVKILRVAVRAPT